jgi:hypothetical protein
MSDKIYLTNLESWNPSEAKRVSLVDAMNRKMAALSQFSAEREAAQIQNADSLVSKLGLSSSSAAGQLVNAGAAIASGSAQGLAFLHNLPVDASAALETAGLNQNEYDAYGRYVKGTASKEDMGLLSRKRPWQQQTVLQAFEASNNKRELARDVSARLDLSHLVNQDDRQALSNSLEGADTEANLTKIKQGWEHLGKGEDGDGWSKVASGLGGLIVKGLQAAKDNPAGALNYLAENVPQLAVGAYGRVGKAVMTGFNAGYAIDNYQQGIENYRKANGGALPPEALRDDMAISAAMAGLAEVAGDGLQLTGLNKALAKPATDLTKQTLKQSLLAAGKGTALGVAEGAVSEGLTETAQTYLEGEAQLKPASGMDIFKGGAIGAMVGGGMAGPFAAIDGASQISMPGFGKDTDAPAVTPNAAMQKAVADRNVGDLADPKSPSFNPAQALAALHTLNASEGTTPEERKTFQAQAKGLVDYYQRTVNALKSNTPDGIKDLEDTLTMLKEEQATLGSDPSAAALQADIDTIQAELTSAKQTAADPELASKITQSSEALANAQKVYDAMTQDTVKAVRDVPVQETLADAQGSDPVKAPQAAKKLLTLSMVSPEAMTAEEIKSVVDNKDNGLTQAERDYLAAFSIANEQIASLKNMKQVGKEVLVGDRQTDQKGLQDYRDRFGKFVAGMDASRAAKELAGLRNFLASHEAKARVMSQAVLDAKNAGKPFQIVRQSDGSWKASPMTQTREELRDAGNYFVNPKSQKSLELVNRVRKEYRAIKQVHSALSQAFDIHFNSKPTAPAQSQESQANAPSTTVAQSQPDQVQESQAPAVDSVQPEPQPVAQAADAPTEANPKTDLDRAVEQAEKEYRRVIRQNPKSLYSAIKHSLSDADLNEVYGTEWKKRYTALKGKNARRLIDQITDGSLDDFLPFNLNFGNGMARTAEDEAAAREHIIERLRERNYLTESTVETLNRLDVTIQALQQPLTVEEITQEFNDAAQDYAIEQAPSTDENSSTQPETQDGSSSGDVASEAGGSEQQSSAPASEQASTNSESQEAAASADGRLSAIADETGPLAGLLKQGSGGVTAVTRRPLVAVKDFLSKWKSGEALPSKFLKEAVTEEQKEALKSFFRFAQQVVKATEKTRMALGEKYFRHRNPVEHLLNQANGTVDMDENVKAAVAAGIMSYLNGLTVRSLDNDEEDINTMLRRPEEKEVSPELMEAFASIGTFASAVKNQIGKKITDALGLKALVDAPKDTLPKIQAALGAYAVNLMVRPLVPSAEDPKKLVPLLKSTEMTVDEMTKLLGDAEMLANVDAKTIFKFVTPVRNTEGELSNELQALVDSQRGANNVVDGLFGTDASKVAPTFEPIPFKQGKAKKSTSNISSKQAEILNKKNQEENYINMDVFNLVASMDQDNALKMFGFKPLDENPVHIDKVKARGAKNNGIKREFANLIEFVSDHVVPTMGMNGGVQKPFFLQHEVWRNFRVGIKNNLFNPQTSKIHRYMMYRPTWQTKVDKTNAAQVMDFKLRVLEGLGVKTDKQDNTNSLTKWESKTGTEVIKAAVAALKEGLQGNPFDQAAVVAGVQEAGEKAHSLNALIALAKYEMTPENGSFDAVLIGEVDGVTNGPMLTHLFLGAADTKGRLFNVVKRGGFFHQDSQHQNYNIYRGSEGALDLYESLAKAVMRNLGMQTIQSAAFQPLWYFVGEMVDEAGKIAKGGRDIVKKPITALMFGSGLGTIQEGLGDTFLDAVYSKMEKLASLPASEQYAKTAELIDNLNKILPSTQQIQHMPLSDLLATPLTWQQRKVLKEAFSEKFGKPMVDTMGTAFAGIIERRNAMTRTAKAMYLVSDAVRSTLRQQYIRELALQGDIDMSAMGENTVDLSQKQEAEFMTRINKLMPVLGTAYSQASGNPDAGLPVAKTKQQMSSDSQYETNVAFQRESGKTNRVEKVAAESMVTADPGVSLVPASIHSSDSYISHVAAFLSEALNIHDAHVAGMGEFTQVAKNLNAATWEALLNYSPMKAMADSMGNMLQELGKLMADESFQQYVTPALTAALEQIKADALKAAPKEDKARIKNQSLLEVINGLVSNAYYTAGVADQMRLSVLAEMGFIDQYALQGGQYVVTDTDREAAVKKLEEVKFTMPDEVGIALGGLGEVLNSGMSPVVDEVITTNPEFFVTVTAMPDNHIIRVLRLLKDRKGTHSFQNYAIDKVLRAFEAGGGTKGATQAITENLKPEQAARLLSFLGEMYTKGFGTVLGPIGKPAVAPAPGLVALFEGQPKMDGSELVEFLAGHLGKSENQEAKYLRTMLGRVKAILPPGLKVQYVTTETLEEDLPVNELGSRGWFIPSTNTIYVRGTEFAKSGLTSELLVHELLHAALVSTVRKPRTEEQKKIVTDLDNLLQQVKAYHRGKSMSDNMVHATGNLDEFISWGLTNQDVRAELGKIQVKSKLGKFVTALHDFITKVTGLLFNRQMTGKEAEVDAFTALVIRVNDLVEVMEASEDRNFVKELQDIEETMNMVSPSPVNDYTTQEVFDSLSGYGSSAVFQERLQTVLDDVVNKLHGPFGAVKTQIEASLGNNPLDVWSALQAKGQRPFSSRVLNAPLGFSQKEAYVAEQVEAVFTHVLQDKSAVDNAVFRELEKLYAQAKEKLKGNIPTDLYKFVFQPESHGSLDGKSNYMARFMALTLANEQFNKAMTFETRKADLVMKGRSFMERVEATWRAATDWVGSWQTGTSLGQAGTSKMAALVTDLVQAESRGKGQIMAGKSITSFFDPIEAQGAKVVKGIRQQVVNATQSKFVKQNSFKVVRIAGVATNIAASGKAGAIVQQMNAMRDSLWKSSTGTALGLVNYVSGISQWANTLLLEAKKVEKQRLAVSNDVSSLVKSSFANEGEDITKEQSDALASVVLRTGMHFLVDSYSMDEILKMLDAPKALKAAIDKEVGALSGYPEVHYYIKQAKGLGFYTATGMVAVDNQMLNAGNIASVINLGGKAPAHSEAAKLVLERLVTLYGLRYSNKDSIAAAASLMRSESVRGDQSGVLMALRMHKHLHIQAEERLFKNSETMMIHGYMPEVVDPTVAFEVARDPAEVQALLDKGYVAYQPVMLDKNDPDKRKAMIYVLRGGGMSRRLTGMVSLTDTKAKGTSKHNQFYSTHLQEGKNNALSMAAISSRAHQEVLNQFKADPGFDPFKAREKQNYMLPILNQHGEMVDYRYVMGHQTRDTLLRRDNRFEHLLGTMAGQTFDKQATREQNELVMEALREHYTKNFGLNPKQFIQVHNTSTDPKMKEIWDMLPEKTKQDVQRIWGTDGLWVPKNMVDVVFGYRKMSLADMYDKAKPNWAERQFMDAVGYSLRLYARKALKMDQQGAIQYAKRGAATVRQIEAGWQEIVQEAKDFIVVKSFTVLRDNMLSNMMMLALKGVPMLDSLRDQHIALKGVMDYERDRAALARLQLIQDTGYGSQSMDEVAAQMVELQDRIARNPIKEMIDAGLLPTLVEDVSMEENPYSYKSELTNWVEDKTSGLNKHVLKAGRFMYMTHDSLLYKIPSKATQYSDFISRYAMYKHLTTRKNPMTSAEAVFEASEAFVNYDIPLPKKIQYMDEMGVLPFIKYFLSIQRVLARNFQDNPLRVLSAVALNNFAGNLPMPTDSSFLTRIGHNPIGLGAAVYPKALTEAATANTILSLL